MEEAQESDGATSKLVESLESLLQHVELTENIYSMATDHIGVDVREETAANVQRGVTFFTVGDNAREYTRTYGPAEVNASASLALPSSLTGIIFQG